MYELSTLQFTRQPRPSRRDAPYQWTFSNRKAHGLLSRGARRTRPNSDKQMGSLQGHGANLLESLAEVISSNVTKESKVASGATKREDGGSGYGIGRVRIEKSLENG